MTRWIAGVLLLSCACAGPDDEAADDESDTSQDGAAAPVLGRCLNETLVLQGTDGPSITVDWAPDAARLLVGSQTQLRLVEVGDTLRTVATFEGHTARVYVHWAPDGRHAITSSDDGTIKLLRIEPETPAIVELSTMALGVGSIYSATWSPDGRNVLTGTERGRIHLVAADFEAEELLLRDLADVHVGKVFSVVWSADGTRALSAGGDHTLRLWAIDDEAGTLTELATHEGAEQYVPVAWSADGTRVLAGQWDRVDAVEVFEVGPDSLRVLSSIDPHRSGSRALVWRDDLVISGDHDHRVHLLRFDAGTDTLEFLDELPDVGIGVHSLSWSPDGDRVARASSKSDRVSVIEVDPDACRSDPSMMP